MKTKIEELVKKKIKLLDELFKNEPIEYLEKVNGLLDIERELTLREFEIRGGELKCYI